MAFFSENEDRSIRKQRMKETMLINENYYEEDEEPSEKAETAGPVGQEGEGNGEGEPRPSFFRRLKEKKWFPFLLAFLIVLLVVGVGGGAWYYFFFRQANRFSVKWTVTMKENLNTEYEPFADGLVKYDSNGACYYNASGTEVWSAAYEMSDPVADVNGDCMIIADRRGNAFCIFNEEGPMGSGSTSLPISRAAVSGKGLAAMILEDTTASYIRFYNSGGELLDIEIKSFLSGDGYPMDLSLSEDGTLLMVSYVALEESSLENKVVFYNFSELGKNYSQRTVGGFQQYEDAIAAEVKFFGQKTAVAFAGDRLSFYSLQNEVSPKLVADRLPGEEIRSVFYNESYVGYATDSDQGINCRDIVIYRTDGTEKCSFTVDLLFEKAEITGNYVVFYDDCECRIYTLLGTLRYSGELSGTISALVSTGGNSFLQAGGQTLKKIVLKP